MFQRPLKDELLQVPRPKSCDKEQVLSSGKEEEEGAGRTDALGESGS